MLAVYGVFTYHWHRGSSHGLVWHRSPDIVGKLPANVAVADSSTINLDRDDSGACRAVFDLIGPKAGGQRSCMATWRLAEEPCMWLRHRASTSTDGVPWVYLAEHQAPELGVISTVNSAKRGKMEEQRNSRAWGCKSIRYHLWACSVAGFLGFKGLHKVSGKV